MKKKEYKRPELSTVRFSLREVILSSPENLSSYLDGGDTPSNPIYEPDDPDNPVLWD